MDATDHARRRQLLAGPAGGMFGALGLPKGASSPTPSPVLLEPLHHAADPTVLLTLSSATRDMDALADAARQCVLPALAKAQIRRASGPGVGALQLWFLLHRQVRISLTVDQRSGID